MNSLTCGFIGLGLIGGSIARALREKIPNVKIIVYDTNPETLEAALGDKVADRAARAIDESFSHCDYLFLCAPVQKNDSNLKAVKKILSPSCLLTDVGSVKSQIHHAVEAAGLSSQFIGGHPMTGSERTGYVNSKALLLENAYFILTPTDKVSSRKVEAYRNLALKLGAIPLVMDCRLHDYVTAAISHLPHVIASSLVNLIPRFYDATKGRVLVDGRDVKDYPLEELRGKIGMVLANGSLSSQSGGEGEIRKNIINDDLVSCIVAMPTQLFYTTQIPVSLWFLSRNKKQKGKTCFIDARKMGTMVSRKLRMLTDTDIAKLAETFDAYENGTLEDVKGFCAVATTAQIAEQDYILTPGRYVGIEEQEDDGEPFDEKMKRLTGELSALFEKSHELEIVIKKNLKAIGFEVK